MRCMCVAAWTPEGQHERTPRRYRDHGVGGRLTVLSFDGGKTWDVKYVSKVDDRHVVWCTARAGATTGDGWPPAYVPPFESWQDAMDHAAGLRTYYGDQCRGDNSLFNRRHCRCNGNSLKGTGPDPAKCPVHGDAARRG